MCEGDVEEETLHYDHDEGLDEEGRVVTSPDPVENPAITSQRPTLLSCRAIRAYLRIEASSIIRGMSREKPEEVRVRWIEYIWSAYEVMGDVIKLRVALTI